MNELSKLDINTIRYAIRALCPETRGSKGLSVVGKKSELVEYLYNKGFTKEQVEKIWNEKPAKPESKPVESETVTAPVTETKPAESKPVTENSDSAAAQLAALRNILNTSTNVSVDKAEVEAIVNEKIEALKNSMPVKVVEIRRPELPPIQVGTAHKLTTKIAQILTCGLNTMLVGPAGSGKTTCCEKVAEILGLKFYPISVGPQTTKSDLLGYCDAQGGYHTTCVREAFEKGGLLLLDEMDAANAASLTILNALLANGYCAFPDGVIKRNPDFRCICACNTYGRGADREYVGRNQLDAATLDRFVVIDFDYDEDLETQLSGNPSWAAKVQSYRRRAFELKCRVVISPRASIFGAKLIAAGIPESEVEDLVIWKGISSDLRMKIRGC